MHFEARKFSFFKEAQRLNQTDEILIVHQQTWVLVIYCHITLDPEGRTHLRLVCGTSDILKGQLPFSSFLSASFSNQLE